MDVERLLLLFRNFLFDGREVSLDGGVVVVAFPRRKSCGRAHEMSLEWDSFSEHLLALWVVCRWELFGRVSNPCFREFLECVVPIAMVIGIFTAQLADEVSIIKMESQQGTGVKQCSIHRQFCWGARRRPELFQSSNRYRHGVAT
jgi:hypothetical protein